MPEKNEIFRKKLLQFFLGYAIITKLSVRHAPLAQLDRASGYGPEGREFESLRAYQNPRETLCFLRVLSCFRGVFDFVAVGDQKVDLGMEAW